MAGNNALNNNDSMDINELAALNEDISPELIEQLQNKLMNEAQAFSNTVQEVNDDSALFEEPDIAEPEETEDKIKEETEEPVSADSEQIIPEKQEEVVAETVAPEIIPEKITIESNAPEIDYSDSFAQKYKNKFNALNNNEFTPSEPEDEKLAIGEENSENTEEGDGKQNIDSLSNGNITEKAITKEQIEYNDSLDLLDGNVKYSKYVVYIDPQNVNFIDGLTIKERKNLINNILREQDDIQITGRRFKVVQAIILHIIVAIITIAISVPIIYYTINASLEASINNYRRSQSNFQTLYREKGKINVKPSWK